MKKLELHPLCTFFPRMDGAEFEALKADIKANGLRQRIVLHKGMILDGGNRYAACVAIGVPPITMDYYGSDPVAFILSANLHRRHLTTGQQAAIVAAAADWGKAQKHGGDRKSDQAVTLPLDTVADRAAQSGASEKTQRDADKVVRADPELGKKVSTGAITLADAKAEVTGKSRKPAKPKAAPAVESDESADLRAQLAEVQATAKTLLEENNAMGATLDADDKLSALTAENKQLREMNRVLEERLRGLQNEVAAAKKAAQSWQRKAIKAERVNAG